MSQVPKAERILAIDEEIAALERINPKGKLYASLLLPLLFMLGAIVLLVFGSSDAGLLTALSLIWPVLLAVAVPSGIYGIVLARNRRRRLRLERELDELIEYSAGSEPRLVRAHWGGKPGGLIT